MKVSLRINEINLNAEVLGQGEPVLCLSGFGCSNYNFDLIRNELSKRFKLVLLDNCGTGKSQDRDSEYTIEDMAKDGFDFMQGLGFKKFHIIGISMGGFIAQVIASKYSDHINSLSLLCTSSAGKDFIPLPVLTEEKLYSFYKLPINESSYLGIKGTVTPGMEEKNPQLFSLLVKLRESSPVSFQVVIKQKRAVDKFLASDFDVGMIKCPTLILSGDKDRFVSPKNSYQLNNKIKNSEVIFIKNTDHLFFFEKFQSVATELKFFINNQIFRLGAHV